MYRNKKSKITNEPNVERNKREYCKIAVRPTKTAPLVISVKAASTASATQSSNTVTSSVLPLVSTTSTPINLFSQVPQVLTTGTPLITSPVPSLLGTPIGTFLTPGLTHTLTIPISATVQPQTKFQQPLNNPTNLNNVNSDSLDGLDIHQLKMMISKLQRQNDKYVKKIRTLQQTVRRQNKMIQKLNYSLEITNNDRFKDVDDLLTDLRASEDDVPLLHQPIIELDYLKDDVTSPDLILS